MNRIIVAAVAAALASTTFAVAAMEEMDMKAMDANHDGMVSKAEYMKYHEAMWSKMKKKNGMVDVNDMGMMGDGMAKGGMAKDSMAKDSMMKGDKGGMMKEKGK